jgi:hypothetical protein
LKGFLDSGGRCGGWFFRFGFFVFDDVFSEQSGIAFSARRISRVMPPSESDTMLPLF